VHFVLKNQNRRGDVEVGSKTAFVKLITEAKEVAVSTLRRALDRHNLFF